MVINTSKLQRLDVKEKPSTGEGSVFIVAYELLLRI